MNYTVYLPSRVSLRPNPAAAKRLAELLRELNASKAVIEVAEQVAEAASKQAEDKPAECESRQLVSR